MGPNSQNGKESIYFLHWTWFKKHDEERSVRGVVEMKLKGRIKHERGEEGNFEHL